jgi:hypothetical protein
MNSLVKAMMKALVMTAIRPARRALSSSVLRIRDVYPGSEIFPSQDPDPHQCILTQNIVSQLSEI